MWKSRFLKWMSPETIWWKHNVAYRPNKTLCNPVLRVLKHIFCWHFSKILLFCKLIFTQISRSSEHYIVDGPYCCHFTDKISNEFSWMKSILFWFKFQLEQLERLRSEDTPTTSWLPIPLSHIGSHVKRRQSQSYKFKKFAKFQIFWILKRALHATHLLKLLDKMCKYEMDPMSIVEDTGRTRFCPQTDRRTRWYQYTPLSTSLKRGV